MVYNRVFTAQTGNDTPGGFLRLGFISRIISYIRLCTQSYQYPIIYVLSVPPGDESTTTDQLYRRYSSYTQVLILNPLL